MYNIKSKKDRATAEPDNIKREKYHASAEMYNIKSKKYQATAEPDNIKR